jgi:hypothetical protein
MKWLVAKMRTRLLIISFAALWTTVVFSQVGISRDELQFFTLLNQERMKVGLPKLQWDYHLAESARAHTQLMASQGMLSHQLPGEPSLGERIGKTGLRFNIGAENVAQGERVEKIHEALMNSPQHRANILSAKYNALGIAVIPQGDELYMTQNFANVLPSYSEQQFQEAVAAAFNKQREANGMAEMVVHSDPHLHDVACSDENDAQQIIHDLHAALNLVVFTTSMPEKLPIGMQKSAANRSLHRMDLGTCFRPGKEHGFGSFRVVAAFYQ